MSTIMRALRRAPSPTAPADPASDLMPAVGLLLARALPPAVALMLLLSCAACCHDGLGGIDALPQASTRGLALGETGLTQTGESECFMINPSCLTSIVGNQARATYGNWFQDLSSSRTILLYATSIGRKIEYPGASDLGKRYGVGVAIDRTGVELSQGSGWASNVLFIGLAWAPAPYLSTGFAPKVIFSSSDLGSGKVSGFSMDWGMRIDISPRVGLGFVLRNLPGNADWQDGESESLPVAYAFGAHVMMPYDMVAEFMFAALGSADDRLGAGLEVPFLDSMLEVRIGGLWLNGIENRSALTAGFGLDLSMLDFDYALKLDSDWATGTTHRFSVRFDF